MDRTIQRYITLAMIMLFTGPLYGQCKKEIKVVEIDSCKKVMMTVDMWAYYYKAEKNLKAIEDSIPKLSKHIEEERAKAEQKSVSLEKQLEIQKSILELEQESKEDCMSTVAVVEVENTRLRRENKLLKKLPKWCIFGGAVLGGTAVGLLKK